MLRLAILLVAMAISGCAGGIHSTSLQREIGPYHQFSGRLLVMEPNRRWQVSIDWRSPSAESGRLRLTHAATGTVVELIWQDRHMLLRDSGHPEYRPVTLTELQDHGIVIPPWTLAAILLGRMPADFQATSPSAWEAHMDGALIRLQWNPDRRRLVLTDVTHGRQATLIIGT